ncbi:hypothetical protein Phum_PHUM590900 [Pediculus humanus corporis]|uniref:Uncharacterized protein n=1 Tax=Pediculus humanus subsp. corporis TaxID=121224 RepID=E0W2E8_PEDHC|nr:uncharacterized protein Phum_PHUM590900 [Pediculus humanus corporis]EEB19804.1 hypothetical protein Phum_PHUM590900 [Pediculus humanus corporis]
MTYVHTHAKRATRAQRRDPAPCDRETADVVPAALPRRMNSARKTATFATAPRPRGFRSLPTPETPEIIVALFSHSSRPDSALEAFRHNPTDGSLAPPVVRPSAEPNVRTCGSSRTEQDYCRNDESHQ